MGRHRNWTPERARGRRLARRPHALYERPANLFVAGFIGSPAMNLAEGTIEPASGDGYVVEFGDTRLRIDDHIFDQRPGLRGSVGRRVVVGIRPEDLEDPAFASDAPDDRRMRAVVDRREPMGPEVYVHFTVDAPLVLTEDTRELAADAGDEAVHCLEEQAAKGTNRFVARMNPRTSLREGEQAEIVVDTSRLYFFDHESGQAIYGDGAEVPAPSHSPGSGASPQ